MANEKVNTIPLFGSPREVEIILEKQLAEPELATFLKRRDPIYQKNEHGQEILKEAGIVIFVAPEIKKILKINSVRTEPQISKLKRRILMRPASDEEIMSEYNLDIVCAKDGSMTPAQREFNKNKLIPIDLVLALIAEQIELIDGKEPKDGILKTNGSSSIFYIQGLDDKVYFLSCSYQSNLDSWYIALNSIYDHKWLSSPNYTHCVFSTE